MTRNVSEKMGVRTECRALLVHAPRDAYAALELPAIRLTHEMSGEFDYIHLFCLDQASLDQELPVLRGHLAPRGMLWVSWPKGRQLGTNLNIREVIRIGYSRGLVESTTLSINATWSAIKFTRPIPGKRYQNSYGTLPDSKTASAG